MYCTICDRDFDDALRDCPNCDEGGRGMKEIERLARSLDIILRLENEKEAPETCKALREARNKLRELEARTTAFELRDATNEEGFYSIGLFDSLEEAKAHCVCSDGTPVNLMSEEEFIRLKVYQVPLGLHMNTEKEVYREEWEQEYIEAEDKWRWKKLLKED